MDKRDQYYDRILKVVGTELSKMKISVHNVSFLARTIELLSGCGIVSYNFSNEPFHKDIGDIMGIVVTEKNFSESLISHLQNNNQFEDRWSFNDDEKIDLVLAGGSWDDCRKGILEAKVKKVPAIIGLLLSGGSSLLQVIFPEDELVDLELIIDDKVRERIFDWADLNNQIANTAKAILLRGTECEHADFNELLQEQKKTTLLAHHSWPWVNRYLDITKTEDAQWLSGIIARGKTGLSQAAEIAGKTVMIFGLGSLGSIAADYFRILGANIIGIDGKKVSINNPVRQIFPTETIGQEKAYALPWVLAKKQAWLNIPEKSQEVFQVSNGSQSFSGISMILNDTDESEKKVIGLFDKYQPDLVILATAHIVEFRLANLLKKRKVTHISAGCYARARWFEAICIEGGNGPCYGCFRGNLYKGPQALLTEEEQIRCGLDEMEAGMMQAEPATRIETSRCADAIARIGTQLILSPEQRFVWLDKMLQRGQNCLIGGSTAEWQEESQVWSYNIDAPGKAVLLGVNDFIGSEDEQSLTCIYCGRNNNISVKRTAIKLDLPTDVEVPFFERRDNATGSGKN